DEFSQREYDLLLANPALFRKFPDEFLCWVGLSRLIPHFLIAGSRVCTVFIMPVLWNIRKVKPRSWKLHPEGELEASVDRLFDGSGSRDHGESAEGGNIVSEQVETVIEDAPIKKVRRQKKRKAVVEDVSAEYVIGVNHPPKRVREDYATPSGPTTGDKSQAILDSLLADARLNVEIMVSPIPTMPFITSSVSVTPDSSHYSSTHPADTKVDSHKPINPSPFLTGSHSTGGAIPSARGFTDLTGSDFMVGGFCTVVNPDTDLQKVYVPKWNVTNGSGVDTATDCRETVDELAPQCFFAVVRNMEHDQLFTEFNVGTARQVCLSVKESLLVQTNEENASLKKQLLLKEAEAVEAIRLRGQAYAFEGTEKSLQEEVKLLRERSLTLEKERDSLVVASQA
ncbi:hypothetical protein Tco_1235301, partial [Tanacetum coccineum]